MLQFNPVPAGRGSFSITLAAVAVPETLLLLTVIVNPIVVPVGTGVASAVLVTLRFGDCANATRENSTLANIGAHERCPMKGKPVSVNNRAKVMRKQSSIRITSKRINSNG